MLWFSLEVIRHARQTEGALRALDTSTVYRINGSYSSGTAPSWHSQVNYKWNSFALARVFCFLGL